MKKEELLSRLNGVEWNDFEDSVQYSVAYLQEMNGIVTRNPNDYREAKIKVWKPEELLL